MVIKMDIKIQCDKNSNGLIHQIDGTKKKDPKRRSTYRMNYGIKNTR